MEQTTCEIADSVKAFNCQKEEQCDDCFMVDHLKECKGCNHYDHPEMSATEQDLETLKMKQAEEVKYK